MANPWSHVLYIGVTSNLRQRAIQHKTGAVPGFTQRYHVTSLVYYEELDGPVAAIRREKQLKGWTRARKLALIRSANPDMLDLAEGWWQDGL